MKELFKDILELDGVKGVILLSFEGQIRIKSFLDSIPEDLDSKNWAMFIKNLSGVRETDLVFEEGRLYIRRSELGYVLIWTSLFTPMAMLRLNCDIVLPLLKPVKSSKSITRFFKK